MSPSGHAADDDKAAPAAPEPDLLSDDPHVLRAEIEDLQKKLAAEKAKGLASTHTETFDKGVRECDILFGKELESLLSGALGDERLLENAFKTLRKFKGTKLALLAAGAPSTLLEKATGSYEFWAAKAGRIGRKDMKAKIGTLHVMWLGATASAAKCPNFLLWWGLVQAAKGATNVELEEMAMLRIVADRKIVRAFESEYASICSENTALWARGLAADGASTCSRDAASRKHPRKHPRNTPETPPKRPCLSTGSSTTPASRRAPNSAGATAPRRR